MLLLHRHARRFLIGFTAAVVAVCLLLVWLAWKTSALSPALTDFFRMMSLGTAFCLALLTLSLLLKIWSSNKASRILCVLVALIAITRFIEVYTGNNFLSPITLWLWGVTLDHTQGQMSQLTSICLFLFAWALSFSADEKTSRANSRHLISLLLIVCVVFLIVISLFGYFLQLKDAFTWMGMRMAPQTGVSLLLLSLAIISLNLKLALQKLYQIKIIQRFSLVLGMTLILGAAVFIIAQQQVNYAAAVNDQIIDEIISSGIAAKENFTLLTKVEYEIKQVILLLTGSFVLACLFLFTGIFLSLNHQLRELRNLLLGATREQNLDNQSIPYVEHKNEFGLIARSIESFIKLNHSRHRLQSRLERIVESMPNGIIIVNAKGRIELVNPSITRMFGYESSQLIGQPLEILIPDTFAKKHPEYLQKFFQEPQARAMGLGRELFGVKQNGQPIPLEIGLAPIESDQGIQVLASVVDISERKAAEANLAANRDRMEFTSRSLGIGVWEYWPADNKLVWDETMFAIYEKDPAGFKGVYEEWRQAVHPDDIAEQEMKFLYAIKTNTEFIAKFRIITSGTRIKYLQAKAKVERGADGQTKRIIGANFDITREELALQKIQQLDNLRLAIVEQSDDAIISKTPEGVVTSWNKGAEKMFGFTAREAIGKNIKDLVIPVDKYQEHDQLLARVMSGEHLSHILTQAVNKSGDLIDVSINFSPIRDEQGRIVSISSIKRDVTESIKAAHAIQEHQQELERSNKSLETFAYVASHDLKAPLRGINQLATWLEDDIKEKNYTDVLSTTDKIKVRIKRMENLLDDLLAYYRVEKMQGFYKQLDVARSVQDLFVMNNTRPGMRLELQGELPIFKTFVTPFEQVLTNLIANAIKHHDRAEGCISVSCRILDQDWFEFCVQDDGPGIDPQFHQRIFNMFQTLKPRDEVEGSGMGLALVKKIVEQYAGEIRIESSGRGSAFYFTWPIRINREI